MATRFLTALEYSDLHTNNILRKHAKKRPLGELETRYNYTPPQPVLSCRTVDIDVSGTRTYRPRSTTDILAEQQKLIHRLFKDGRAVTSAPPRRTPRKGLGQVNDNDTHTRAKIHVQGRPYTSMSQSSEPSRQKSASSTSSQRPKTTGRLKNIKPATDSFMELAVNEDMLETRRSHNELTNQIHAHWRPESSNLNQGHFMRGQKRPDDVPPSLDAWLTFGGVPGEETGGVVDAFANFQSAEDYYNIEGSVGSRVAQQLQKGDKIRIGVNGDVLSHDLKVKKWVKGEQTPAESERSEEGEEREETQGRLLGSAKEKNSPASENGEDMFGDILFETFDNALEGTAAEEEVKKPKTTVDFPLSWDDQVSRPQVKVIKARVTPRDNNSENLCETHPVLFNTITRTPNPRPKLASYNHGKNDGYRIKQRPLGSSTPAVPHNRLDNTGGKVKAISFDHNSPEDEQRLNNMSVDDVIQTRLDRSDVTPIPGMPSSARAKQRTTGSQNRNGNGAEEGDEDTTNSAETGNDAKNSRDNNHFYSTSRHKENSNSQQRSVSASWTSSTRSRGDSHVTGDRVGSGKASRPLTVPRPSSSMPRIGARDLHLSSVTPVSASGVQSGRGQGSGKGRRSPLGFSKPLPFHRQHLGGGISSINAGPIPGETEFIQISQPIRNPKVSPASSVSGRGHGGEGLNGGGGPYLVNSTSSTPIPPRSPPRSNTPQDGMDFSAESTRAATPIIQVNLHSTQDPQEAAAAGAPDQDISVITNDSGGEAGNGRNMLTSASDGSASQAQSAAGFRAISIPTGGHHLEEEEEEDLTVAQRRERTLRDQQIDQITTLLGGAILNGDQK